MITFNIDGLNSPRKHKDPTVCCLQDSHFRCNETDRIGRNRKRYSMQMGNQKKAGWGINA